MREKTLGVALSVISLAANAELKVTYTDPVGCRVENRYFIADLSKRMVQDKAEDSGMLRALTLKRSGVTLARTENRMHWAPNFQRTGAQGYASMGTWQPVQKVARKLSGNTFVLEREGYHQDYPEIHLKAEYRFLGGVPYFLFHSVLTVERPMEMYWLRNQEMTMDDLFTHVAWPGRDGRPRMATFAERGKILEQEPIPVSAPWVCFVNLDKGYGYGAVMLEHRATKTANPMVTIEDGARNGKYWNRQLVNRTATRLEPGDQFEERTAYVVFQVKTASPLAEFLTWEKRIRAAHK
jgi:hypothetical protein